MGSTDAGRLAEFSLAVRSSSLKRLRRVPEGNENRRGRKGLLSFADIAQHLIDCDEWLFRKLADDELAPITEASHRVVIEDRDQYAAMLDRLEALGQERADRIRGLTPERFESEVFDPRFGGTTSLWWVIVRGNLDHEIHHRGQVAALMAWMREDSE